MKYDELKHQLMLNKDMSWVPCYFKSEADKVIAEKNAEIVKLKSLKQALMADDLRYRDRIRHQKYKRCLANAWWCRKLSNTYTLSAYTHRGWKIARYYDEKAELYRKWHKRWLAIAEKFKPNKEAK